MFLSYVIVGVQCKNAASNTFYFFLFYRVPSLLVKHYSMNILHAMIQIIIYIKYLFRLTADYVFILPYARYINNSLYSR